MIDEQTTGRSLARAVQAGDGSTAIAICDRLRARGWRYPAIVAAMTLAAPDLDASDLDGCIREAEEVGAY